MSDFAVKPTPGQQTGLDIRAYAALQDLAAHPAWPVLVAEFKAEHAKLAEVVFSRTTPPEKAEFARQLYIGLQDQYSPQKVLSNGLARLKAIYDRHAAEIAKNRPPTS